MAPCDTAGADMMEGRNRWELTACSPRGSTTGERVEGHLRHRVARARVGRLSTGSRSALQRRPHAQQAPLTGRTPRVPQRALAA